MAVPHLLYMQIARGAAPHELSTHAHLKALCHATFSCSILLGCLRNSSAYYCTFGQRASRAIRTMCQTRTTRWACWAAGIPWGDLVPHLASWPAPGHNATYNIKSVQDCTEERFRRFLLCHVLAEPSMRASSTTSAAIVVQE